MVHQLEPELSGIEIYRATHVADLIPNAVEPEDETLYMRCIVARHGLAVRLAGGHRGCCADKARDANAELVVGLAA